MTSKSFLFAILILLAKVSFGQQTQLLYAFDYQNDTTMSDSCLFGKRFMDENNNLIRQEWMSNCADSAHWARWKYRENQVVLQELGNDSISVVYRPVHRSRGLYQYIAMDTVPQWPYRIIFENDEDGNITKEEWFTSDLTPFTPTSRINHTKLNEFHRQETWFNSENQPVEIIDYLLDEEGNLKEIHFRRVGEKRPFRIVRVFVK